jgi:lipoate-protein ligase A
MKFLKRLTIYQDLTPRSAAMNMAVDEALVETAKVPSIRFYRWQSPAISFGYFGKFADIIDCVSERDLVRRWTGGGIVLHGDDLTYSIVIPANDAAFTESTMSIYEKVHRALRDALGSNGPELATVVAVCDRRIQINSAVRDRRYNDCFANPVCGDVMLDGHKIAGAAQRRTRTGLLHQGSIQHVDPGNGLAERFAKELSNDCRVKILGESLIERAYEIAEKKYGSVSWLQRR